MVQKAIFEIPYTIKIYNTLGRLKYILNNSLKKEENLDKEVDGVKDLKLDYQEKECLNKEEMGSLMEVCKEMFG